MEEVGPATIIGSVLLGLVVAPVILWLAHKVWLLHLAAG